MRSMIHCATRMLASVDIVSLWELGRRTSNATAPIVTFKNLKNRIKCRMKSKGTSAMRIGEESNCNPAYKGCP